MYRSMKVSWKYRIKNFVAYTKKKKEIVIKFGKSRTKFNFIERQIFKFI